MVSVAPVVLHLWTLPPPPMVDLPEATGVLTGDALANVVGMAGLVALACLEGLAALCASEGCDGSGTSSPVL